MCIFSFLNAPLNTKEKKKIKEAVKHTVFTVMALIRCTWLDMHYGDVRVKPILASVDVFYDTVQNAIHVVQDHEVDKGG